MRDCAPDWKSDRFCRIYAEDPACGTVKRLRAVLGPLPVVPVASAAHVTARKHQSYAAQHARPAVVVGAKPPPLIYPLPHLCADDRVIGYYAPVATGCPYLCAYCYLPALTPCGHLQVYDNQEEIRSAVAQAARAADGPVWLSISYQADLLAWEPLLGLCRRWIGFARQDDAYTVECRTKCGRFDPVADLAPTPRFVWAWTLGPRHPNAPVERAPGPDARLRAARAAQEKGWRIRVCLDPVLPFAGWRDAYTALVDAVLETLDPDRLQDVTVGPARMSSEHAKVLARTAPHTAPLPPVDASMQVVDFVAARLTRGLDAAKIAPWTPPKPH